MRKEFIVKAMIEIIEEVTKEKNLKIKDKGPGHAFDNTFWKDFVKDTSNIPNIIATNDDFKIEIRSFWGCPELSVRRDRTKNEELLVLAYSDYDKGKHTGDFQVNEIRCYSRNNYKECMKTIYEWIEKIENEISKMNDL